MRTPGRVGGESGGGRHHAIVPGPAGNPQRQTVRQRLPRPQGNRIDVRRNSFAPPGARRIQLLLATNHHGLVLVPQTGIHRNQGCANRMSLLGVGDGKPELHPDVGGVLGFGSQRHQGVGALPRPLESTRVIDVSVGFPAQIDQKSFGFGRGSQPNPGPPSPFAGIFQLDPRKGTIVEPGQMLPVVNVFPDPLEGYRDSALVHRTQFQFGRHKALSPFGIRRTSARGVKSGPWLSGRP